MVGAAILIFALIAIKSVELKAVNKRQIEDYKGVECTFNGRTFRNGYGKKLASLRSSPFSNFPVILGQSSKTIAITADANRAL